MVRSGAVRLSSILAPGDREFFDLFEEAGGNIERAAASQAYSTRRSSTAPSSPTIA